jgi:hypothetical protein
VARQPKIRAGRRTQEIVTWTIGVVVVVALWLLGSLVLRHLGIG